MPTTDDCPHVTILGGGPAGLAAAYYARQAGRPFTVYEAKDRVGGNAVTLQQGAFLFDSGAHRFHDRDPEATREVQALLGDELALINVPSEICDRGAFLDFPLSPLNLMKALGLATFSKAALEIARSRLSPPENDGSFEAFALRTYGRTVAERFLLNYSEKLWGAPCRRLSANIAGKRLKGLDVKSFVVEALLGRKAKTTHLETSLFLYPRGGIGTIADRLALAAGPEHIRTHAAITRVFRGDKRIEAVEVNGTERVAVDEVISSLPLDYLLRILSPSPPEEVMRLAGTLRFRRLILVALFLNQPSVTPSATVYFPDRALPFTRVYEPRNRSERMSPPGKTSLVAEIPCQREDAIWRRPDEELVALVRERLVDIGWVTEDRIIDTAVHRMDYAYPILELGADHKVERIDAFLAGIPNLKRSGRNGLFQYTWIHNMMKRGREIITQYTAGPKK